MKTIRIPFVLSILPVVLFLSCTDADEAERQTATQNPHDPRHSKVYYEEESYAGWPANHGIWSWDDEILFGFVKADHEQEAGGLHTYDQSTTRIKYARSLDGGKTWTIKDAYEAGQTGRGYDHELSEDEATTPREMKEPIEDFTDPNFILTFLREDNDHGPSHFYYSNDKGASWEGPFRFPDLGTPGVATRTDYIVNGEKDLGVFLTVAKENGNEGRVAYARTQDGGLNWEIVSWIGPEPQGFDIMPSSVRLSDTEIYTTIRSRTPEGLDLITAYRSEDNGETWQQMPNPVFDTGRGGSPPSLVQMEDGRLALAYIYRSEYGSRVNIRLSEDNGETWSDEIMLRGGDGASRDAGYPRMVQRPDGKLLMVYYWNHALRDDATPYRYIAATLFNPENL
ncbi:MAG: sialidase family protein [Balneolaceae bacterium]|nr:sialidase family protein [Balneolaceae bacterium]